MERTLFKSESDHTFKTKRIDHRKKSSSNHFLSIFNSASFITQYILCKNFFYKSSNVFFKVNGTDVEQLYNIFFYL
jgi:hypothetical protein